MLRNSLTLSIDEKDLFAWWQVPNILWRNFTPLTRFRNRRAMEIGVLPLLQRLEQLYLERFPDSRRYLVGKTFRDIESDDRSLEAFLHFYELAVEENILKVKKAKKAGEAPRKKRSPLA